VGHQVNPSELWWQLVLVIQLPDPLYDRVRANIPRRQLPLDMEPLDTSEG
jgi:hypothetical protein